MCLKVVVECLQCGHSITYNRKCTLDGPVCGRETTMRMREPEFCQECFSLPDPRTSVSHRRGRNDAYSRYRPESRNFVLSLAGGHILKRAERLDLDTISIREELLPIDAEHVMKIHAILMDYFWERINSGLRPSSLHRNLLTKIHRVGLLSQSFQIGRNNFPRRSWLRTMGVPNSFGFAPVDLASLEPKSQCIICQEELGIENPEGVTEIPVRTPCYHLYGQQCLSIWLENNDTCPLCRQSLQVPLPEPPQLDHTPAWLSTLASIPGLIPSRPVPEAEELARLTHELAVYRGI